MNRITQLVLLVSLAVILGLLTSQRSSALARHKKVVIHVPYKVHTIHHHTYKTVPVVHYYGKRKSRAFYPDDEDEDDEDYEYNEDDYRRR